MNGDETLPFDEQHIPGSVYFDIDEIADPDAPLPHTLSSPEIFVDAVGKMGISDQDTIVVYEGADLVFAARVWWNFRIMGAKNVFILNGGFREWLNAGLPVESGTPTPSPKTFTPKYNPAPAIFFDAMSAIVDKGEIQIADARARGRFSGEEQEPRDGMRSGHMPGAKSVPFTELLKNGKLGPVEQLLGVYKKAGIDLNKPIVTSCGSGVTAAILILALETIGHKDAMLYDGSWTEWGGREDTKIITGE